MNVLSLFDGHSTGYLALKDAGIKIDNYYASEIDPNPIAISEKNTTLSKDKVLRVEDFALLILYPKPLMA